MARLTEAGWRVVEVRYGQPVPEAWEQLAGERARA